MKVYVAGPYSQGDPIINIRTAIEAAEQLVAAGHTPFVPHLAMLWHLTTPHTIDFWYAYDLEWLAACDALLRLPGASFGADQEVKTAVRLGLPVYLDVAEIP